MRNILPIIEGRHFGIFPLYNMAVSKEELHFRAHRDWLSLPVLSSDILKKNKKIQQNRFVWLTFSSLPPTLLPLSTSLSAIWIQYLQVVFCPSWAFYISPLNLSSFWPFLVLFSWASELPSAPSASLPPSPHALHLPWLLYYNLLSMRPGFYLRETDVIFIILHLRYNLKTNFAMCITSNVMISTIESDISVLFCSKTVIATIYPLYPLLLSRCSVMLSKYSFYTTIIFTLSQEPNLGQVVKNWKKTSCLPSWRGPPKNFWTIYDCSTFVSLCRAGTATRMTDGGIFLWHK